MTWLKHLLEDFGLTLPSLTSGFIGSVIAILYHQKVLTMKQKIVRILIGTSSAAYLAPLLAVTNSHIQSALSFLIGVTSMELLPLLATLFLKRINYLFIPVKNSDTDTSTVTVFDNTTVDFEVSNQAEKSDAANDTNTTSTGNKFLLAIGINNYPLSYKLNGCVNDANNIIKLFRPLGYNTDALLNERATKHNIVQRIKKLMLSLQKGDTAIIYFSGHGTFVNDLNKDEKADGIYDEAICPIDAMKGYLIIDDELNSLFSMAHPEANILFISDSCHSGSNQRLIRFTEGVESLDVYSIPKFMDSTTVTPIIDYQVANRRDINHLAGCLDNQFSNEVIIDGKHCGLMTHHFIKAFNKTTDKNFKQIFDEMLKDFPVETYQQTPKITVINNLVF